jgi:hypothetical protein
MNTQPTENSSKKKGCLIGLGIMVVLIVSLSHIVTSSEAIPNRAKFVYDTRLKIIVPCPEIGKPVFYPVPGKFNDVCDSLTSQWDGVVSWEELCKKDSPCAGYDLPAGKGWNDFVLYGKPLPLWKTILFKPPSRWDESGYWRY